MPMFREDSESVAMIKHAMDMIWKGVNPLNNGQPIVIALDQLLYAIPKRIEWQWPEEYGIHRFHIMLGGLHIEMAYLSALGDWLNCCGWVAAITNSEIAKGGVAESFLSSSKVSKTRYNHQVTLCALEILLKRAYNEEAPTQPSEEWKSNKENKYPQFKFWSLTRNMEMLLLRFVRSLRSKNFKLFVESLEQMLPSFFALDHLNYAKWLSVHLKDLKSLSSTNPTIYEAFLEGNFVVTKTLRNFSSIPIDYAYEQKIRLVKEDGGAIRLTENTAELTRWMICGPEIARIVK